MNSVSLGEVATIERQGVDPAELPDDTRYIGLEHIERGGQIIGSQSVSEAALTSTKFRFGTEHVLFGKLRPNLGKVARPSFAGVCSTDILPIKPGPNLHGPYLAHFLSQPVMIDFAAMRASGANLPRLSPKSLAAFEVPLPTLDEQRRIAAILDHADTLRAKRRQVLAHLDALTQSIFLHTFGDPVINERRLPIRRLAELGALDRGVSTHRPRNDPSLLGGGHPLIQTGDVANSSGRITGYSSTYSDLGLAQSKLWPAGTLCITIAANIAKTGVLTFDACFPDSVVGFTSDPVTTRFVQVWLRFLQSSLESSAPQSAQKNINLKVLRNLEVPTPGRAELVGFADRVDQVDRSLDEASNAVAGYDELFATLQSRAFRGDL